MDLKEVEPSVCAAMACGETGQLMQSALEAVDLPGD